MKIKIFTMLFVVVCLLATITILIEPQVHINPRKSLTTNIDTNSKHGALERLQKLPPIGNTIEDIKWVIFDPRCIYLGTPRKDDEYLKARAGEAILAYQKRLVTKAK